MGSMRSIALVCALILLVALGIGHLFVAFLPDASSISAVVVYGDVALGALSLVAAYGLWNLKRRLGLYLAFLIAALNIVSAAPGMVAAPTQGLRVAPGVYALVSLIILELLTQPAQRTAFA